MPNMSKKRMGELLQIMLQNIRNPIEGNIEQYQRVRIFAGDDSWMRIQAEGAPPIELRPAPSANLGASFRLVDEGCNAFDEYVEEIRKDDVIGSRVGRKAVEGAISTLLRTLRNESDLTDEQLNIAIRESLKSLRAHITPWRAFVPIDNLTIEGLTEVPVGKVILRPYTLVSQSIREAVFATIDGTLHSDEEKEVAKQQMDEYLRQLYSTAPTCAEVVLDVEESRLPELVDSEVDASLNLLRCYTHLLFPREARAFIGLRGIIVNVFRPCLGFTADETRCSLTAGSVGALQSYTITPERLQHLKDKRAFDILSGVLSKSEPSQFERVIITAIRWLGRGVVAPDAPEQVLNIAVALERLLTVEGEEHTDITERLALRLAFLVADSQESRERVYTRAKQLYGLRSDIVHAGRTSVAGEDIAEMEGLACVALVRMAQRLGEWKEHSDFTKWAKQQILR